MPMDGDRISLDYWTQPRAIPGSQVSTIFAPGAVERLGESIKAEGGRRILLVTDEGIRAAGHLDRAVRSIYRADLVARIFDDVVENPTTQTVDAALRVARQFRPDLIVGLGGGSSMDTAKGVNFLYTNGGRMQDYWGTGKAAKEMLPLIAIPTTAGTGSEAQSYALITDPETHMKMACGDKKALTRLAILDPELVATVPPKVAAATGIDAIAHAVETAGCTRRNDVSRRFSADAWRLLNGSFEEAMTWHGRPAHAGAEDALASRPCHVLRDMLFGAHLAGCAIENSMLGAAHALANPLSARYGTTHGIAVGMMLPHVVRFNTSDGVNSYSDVMADAAALAQRLERLRDLAGVPRSLAELGVTENDLPDLAAHAAKQWTATFNPRPVGQSELLALYQQAWA